MCGFACRKAHDTWCKRSVPEMSKTCVIFSCRIELRSFQCRRLAQEKTCTRNWVRCAWILCKFPNCKSPCTRNLHVSLGFLCKFFIQYVSHTEWNATLLHRKNLHKFCTSFWCMCHGHKDTDYGYWVLFDVGWFVETWSTMELFYYFIVCQYLSYLFVINAEFWGVWCFVESCCMSYMLDCLYVKTVQYRIMLSYVKTLRVLEPFYVPCFRHSLCVKTVQYICMCN